MQLLNHIIKSCPNDIVGERIAIAIIMINFMNRNNIIM